ncbi:MAG: ATP-binding protein, partial [Methanoculleus sp.]
MANIDDLIEYYDENLNLDFKGSQYTIDEHADLIKDIIAMANADTNDECYIIIVVIHNNVGQKELRGISREGFIDDAVYQQLIRENVEPDIKFEYSLYEYAGKCFGVFKIGNCDDKP